MRRLLIGTAVVLAGFAAVGYYAETSGDRPSWRASLQGVQVEFDRHTLDFGETPSGVAATSYVVLTNRGDNALTVAAFGSQGAFRALQGAVTVEPGGAAMLTFEFLPQRSGPYEARFAAKSEAGGLGVLSMRGVALSPPRIAIEPRSLDFGPVVVGEERVTPVKISNHGEGALHISSLASIARFEFSKTTLDIPPGEHAVVRVSFKPTRVGPSSAQLVVQSNDPERSGVGLSVKGFGTEQGLAPIIDIRPSTLSFGQVAPGSRARRWVEIRNLSSDPLTITSVLVDGPFRIATRSREIAPRGFIKLPVTLSPQSGDTEIQGTLSIFSNDPAAGAVAIAVQAQITDNAPTRDTTTPTRTAARSGTLFGTVVDLISGESPGGGGATSEGGTDIGLAGEGPGVQARSDTVTTISGGVEVEEGSYLNLASYNEALSTPHIETASYDSQNGTVTLEGLQLPDVSAAMGQHYSFSKTDVVATVSETGEVTATVPVQLLDKFGNATVVDIRFTTDTATAVFDGTEIALAGSPLGADGSMSLVALERVPGGTLEGRPLQLNLNVRVE